MKKKESFLTKKIVITTTIIAVIAIVSYFYFTKTKPLPYDFIVAERSDLIQEVSVTGRVKPAREVDLAFENGGKITSVNINIGDKVYSGTFLAAVENLSIKAQLEQAQANVKIQNALLKELLKGTREEEIRVQEAKVKSAQVALQDAKTGLADKIQDAYTKSDDAVRNKVDQFFNNPTSADPQINFTMVNSQMENDIEWDRFTHETTLDSWKASLSPLSNLEELTEQTSSAKENLIQIKNFLDKIAQALNSLKSNSSITQTTINGYRTAISTARTNINTATTNLSTAEEKFRTSESNLSIAENELTLKKAGAIEEQVTVQEAKVEEAEASVKNYEAQLARTSLYSPINGVVTKQDAKKGEIVSAGASIISLISESEFEIETDMPEADIAKIEIGDSAAITLDAYGDDVIFNAKVTKIDPAETMIEGVATYKTTLQFIEKDKRVKSGMTANIDISTDARENVIAIPQRAIFSNNGAKMVRIIIVNEENTEEVKEVEIKTGLRSSYGKIEIISGLEEGDKIITFFNNGN